MQSCNQDTVISATSSSRYPSSKTMSDRNDFCSVVNKVKDVCKDPDRKKVFETKYKGQFSCVTFTSEEASSCESSPTFIGQDLDLENAVVEYARDNMARHDKSGES